MDTTHKSFVPPRRQYVRAIGPRLRIVLVVVLGLTALLAADSAYLLCIRLLERFGHAVYQNYFYQYMFLGHLALGLLLVLPFLVFGIFHLRNAHNRPQRRAVRIGYALFAACLILLITGVVMVRLGPFVVKDPRVREIFYWLHVTAPVMVIWLFVLHRLAGPRIRWKSGMRWALATAALIAGLVYVNSRNPRPLSAIGPKEGERYFRPSLARTASGNFIPARTLMGDQYCLQCHQDNYQGWFHSAHHFSSFNNPAYLFSVRETRRVALQRDGNVRAARWCAGCHDPVPFFSGAFDNPAYDDVHDPTAQAGITCTACHAITHVNSTRGNADFTIEEPVHYPFAFSDNRLLRWINRQLIKAKPEFHKQTFLKPLHKTAEFCSVCHKVSIPGELNHYKEFLRGQNHYDSYLLSGVSGHSARSFYYPEHATPNCAGCHMPPRPSDDFGATAFDPLHPGLRSVHDHFFPAANTGIAALRHDDGAVKAEQDFLKDVVRVDLFGIKPGGIDSPVKMLRPNVPSLVPGKDYLLEVVIRTLKIGHPLTQGTVDSNEIWLDMGAAGVGQGSSVIGQSGALGPKNAVDPWAFFANVYMLDRKGNRIDRRNVQDIFTPLYDHQIPPGAARVVHYHLKVPLEQKAPVTLDVKLQYRKFDARYMQYMRGDSGANTLPITTLAHDRMTLTIDSPSAMNAKPENDVVDKGRETVILRYSEGSCLLPTTRRSFGVPQDDGEAGNSTVAVNHLKTSSAGAEPLSAIPPWQRWNDYGIGLLLEGSQSGDTTELSQAAQAFEQVERLGRSEGALNLARVYFKEGRLDLASNALDRSEQMTPAPPPWTVAWLRGLIDQQNGRLDRSIAELQSVVDGQWPDAARRGFDFSKDTEVLNELGKSLWERAKGENANSTKRRELLQLSRIRFEQTLAIDPENLSAVYALSLIFEELGDGSKAAEYRALHARYRPDDNARDQAVRLARGRDKAADHAAGAVVIYELEGK